MHHVKSDARRHAYADPKNPFGRWRPNRTTSSASRRAEEGRLNRTQTAPDEFRPGSSDDREYAHSQRQHKTDPYAQSRQRTTEPGDNVTRDLERVGSPDNFEGEKPSYDPIHSDRTSSTEVPRSNEAGSSAYQKDVEGGEKKRHHISDMLHLKKSKSNAESDDDNGKNKKSTNQKFTPWGQFRAIVLGSWINVLLIFSPIGIALHFAKVNDVAIFVVNFVAIIPLAGTLSYATEEIALRTGEVLGGLLNATFGNAVELIVSIIALFDDQFLIVQTSLLGSMLSNLLLVLGMAFFLGGANRFEQAFNTTVAQTAASLLFLAVSALIIPTVFEAWAQTGNDKTSTDQQLVSGVPELSHATAVILLMVYGAYLFFQLKSHVKIYTAPSEKNKSRFTEEQKEGWKKKTGVTKIQAMTGRRPTQVDPASLPDSPVRQEKENDSDDEEEQEQPQISLTVACITLAASTALVALNAEFLVDSLNSVTCSSNGISKTFVGLILLPIVGNAAEHFTAVSVAIKDKMDLAIGVAVGSSMQIALLVLPFVVVIGWIAGKGDQMTLYFDGFQLAALFVAVLLVNYLIQDGKSHWLEGLQLMMLYIIIACAAWFYPTSEAASGCS